MYTNYWEDERVWPSPRLKDVRGYTPIPTERVINDALDRIACQVRLSPACSREREYQFKGKLCCAHCYSLIERSFEAVEEPITDDPQCEAERMAVELERRR